MECCVKKKTLKILLKLMCIPKDNYNLDERGRKVERWCLFHSKDYWQVYYAERGIKTTDKRFRTESEACRYIFREILAR